MAVPQTWYAPSGPPAGGFTGFGQVSYAGGYWFTVEGSTAYYATDPTGTWTEFTFNSFTPLSGTRVVTDGTTWAYSYKSGNITGTPPTRTTYIVHATDPTGTWNRTAVNNPTGRLASFNDLTFADGYWVGAGQTYNDATPWSGDDTALVSHATDPSGTWTHRTGSSGTDYADTEGVSTVVHDGTVWTTFGFTTAAGIRTTSDIVAGSWASPASFSPGSATDFVTTAQYLNGVVMILGDDAGARHIFYASDPTGTWTAVTPATLGPGEDAWGFGYAGGWLLGTLGGYGNQMVYRNAATPDGAFAAVASPGFDVATVAREFATHGRLVIATGNNELRWGIWTDGATYLRQRQSPVRAPSRVRPPQVRQRQRPEVT